ncbi:MAG TPA: transporter substrate-binding domain-containing protein [Azospirillaceae bacterium]|nr:transporter substrate-binding domain-containing protein [Azospirillaceae bacterium]
MRGSGLFAVAAMLLGLLGPVHRASAGDERLLLLTEENPPYNFTDPATGRVAGAAVEMLEAVMAEAGVAYAMEVQPWGRAYNRTLATTGTCLFSANRSAERERLFAWVPLLRRGGGWVIFTRADRPLEVKTLEQAKRHPVLVVAGGPLEASMRAQGFDVIPVRSDAIFRMLDRGRADLAVMGSLGGPWRAKAAGVAIRPVLMLERVDLWLACNLDTPAPLLRRLEAAVERVEASGQADLIHARWR